MNPYSILLLAPPSSGKTTFILDYIEKFKQSILYISPLRSLNREFAARCSHLNPQILSKKLNSQSNIIISTPESFLLHGHKVDLRNKLIVLDEIHLFLDWGNSFRPQILECLYELLESSLNIVSMTATMSGENLKEWRELCRFQSHDSLIFNGSNLRLKTEPQKCYDLSSVNSDDLYSLVIYEAFYRKRKTIVFVKTKKQAELLSQQVPDELRSLYCTSENMEDFMEKLEVGGADIIFSTIALSHGVNLPPMDTIFITYKIQEHSHFIQILARAGRNGEAFVAYHKQELVLAGVKLCKPYHLYLIRAVILLFQCLKKVLF